MTEIEKLEVEIKTLQKKLELLKEIETHKSQPRMNLQFNVKGEVVSYNDEVYYRLEFTDEVYWCKRKYDDDVMVLVDITDGETHRLLEGLWFNEVKGGKYDEPDCPDEPYRNVRAYWDEKDNPASYITDEVVNRLVKKYQAQKLFNRLVDELGYDFDACNDVVDLVEDWLPKEQSAAGSQNAYVECSVEGFNDCLTKIKGKLR